MERIWRREGLKVPQKQKPRGRLWLNDGSCIRLRPERRNHVWSYDFVSAKTYDGRARATNSGPLSERMCSGMPFIAITSAKASITLAEDHLTVKGFEWLFRFSGAVLPEHCQPFAVQPLMHGSYLF